VLLSSLWLVLLSSLWLVLFLSSLGLDMRRLALDDHFIGLDEVR
jgi:hypothetical protein